MIMSTHEMVTMNVKSVENDKNTNPALRVRPKKRRCKKSLMNSLSETDWLSESHLLSEAANSLSGCKTLGGDKSDQRAASPPSEDVVSSRT
ncbi:hypothetical protein HKD37_13G038032 [Glycine soja]